MEKVEIPAKVGRLVNAVASIGYDPEVAICDLMDNSIDASATLVKLILIPELQESEGETDTIFSYIISDNGCGMDRDGLLNAFTLGASRDYPSGSLGKFGLGLKSAGLSLGDQLVILTKREEDEALLCGLLSKIEIEESGKYEIDIGEPPEHYKKLWDKYAASETKGTLLCIEQLNDSQPSYRAFLDYMKRYCGVLYHMFLEDIERNLSIQINEKPIEPIDPLFMEEAQASGSLSDPQHWTGREVQLLLSDQELPLSDAIVARIAATHLIHPPTFELEGRQAEMRSRYNIESDPYTRRPRHGFYIYRNKRVITLAERFHGVISSQFAASAFRARLMFEESADDILQLDVKKRHCQLPKAARNHLKNIIGPYHTKSVEAWKIAGAKYEKSRAENKDKNANESILNAAAPVTNLDYSPGEDLGSEEKIKAREERQKEVKKITLDAIQDDMISAESLTNEAQSRNVVVRVDSLKANAMWLPYPAIEIGKSETVLNNSHSWVTEVSVAAESDAKITVILYQLFTILSRAELEVRTTQWNDVSTSVVEKVMDRFRKRASIIGEDLAESLAEELRKLGGDTNSAE